MMSYIKEYTVFVRIVARASISFPGALTRPLFEPSFYSSPASIIIFFLILGLVSNTKSVVYSMAPHMGRMTASQDSHATSSVMKESVVRSHHVYKVAAASLVVFSAHSMAFNLKETL